MKENKELVKFLDAQNQMYLKALAEVRNGKKESHWMWFVFPQIKGLGFSETAKFYGIADLDEAEAYLAHPVLGKHLIEISDNNFDNAKKIIETSIANNWDGLFPLKQHTNGKRYNEILPGDPRYVSNFDKITEIKL